MKKYCVSWRYRFVGIGLIGLAFPTFYWGITMWSAWAGTDFSTSDEGISVLFQGLMFSIGAILELIMAICILIQFPVVKVTEWGLEYGVFRKVRIAWEEISYVGYSAKRRIKPTWEQVTFESPLEYDRDVPVESFNVVGPSTPYFQEVCRIEHGLELFFIYRMERIRLIHMLNFNWKLTMSGEILDKSQLPQSMVVLPADENLMMRIRDNGNIRHD